MPEFVEWMLGFPDGWTEGVSRTQRLRMLGNSVQVQVAEAIGHYLQELA
jgi:site-specific DNA-cytosine methylase